MPISAEEWTEIGAELFNAVIAGDLVTTQKALAKLGYPVDCYNDESKTPLALAAENGRIAILERLLKPFGVHPAADPDARCLGAATAMMYAAYKNQTEAVATLIQYKADPALMDDEGMTALMFAVQADAKETIQILLNDQSSLFSAAERGYIDYVQFLLERGIAVDSLDENGNTALLRVAMATKHFDEPNWAETEDTEAVAQLLLEWGADIAAIDPHFQQTSLGWAIKTCKPKLAEALRGAGADIEGRTAQHFTVRGQSLLLSAIAEIQETEETPYDAWPTTKAQIADKYLANSIIERMIKMGANVEAADGTGRTALMYAASLGDVASVEVLAQHADLEVTDYEGQTAVVYATMAGREKAAQVLLQHGANTNVRDRHGNMLWQVAEAEGHYALGKMIQAASRGSNID